MGIIPKGRFAVEWVLPPTVRASVRLVDGQRSLKLEVQSLGDLNAAAAVFSAAADDLLPP